MPKPGARDMEELIKDLSSSRKPREKKKQGKPQVGFLIAAIVVIIGGSGYIIYRSLTPTPEQESVEAEEPQSDPDERQLQPPSIQMPGGSPGAPGQVVKESYSRNLRPAFVMDRLPLPATAFGPVAKLRPPTKVKPLRVYVLLYSLLDSYTEQMWMSHGLFRDEQRKINPFIRTVTLTDDDGLTFLTDWHVESAAEIPPEPPTPTQPAQPAQPVE
jgi:hypothetical protein